MVTKYKLSIVVIISVVALLLLAGTGLAQPPGPPVAYRSYVATCTESFTGPPWMTGEVLHIRGLITTGRTFGDPYFAGTFENHTDINLNLKSGSGNSSGTTRIVPDEYDGAWQDGHFSGPVLNFMYSGQGIDYGTGELEGLMDVVHLQQIDPANLPADFADPCNGNPVLSAFVAEGMIIER